jgi:nitrogen fixation/metabolism regulation signal transduction histidine kinase
MRCGLTSCWACSFSWSSVFWSPARCRSIRSPLAKLGRFARVVRGGDLTQRVDIPGRDEIAELATALNEMVHGLRERDRVKVPLETFPLQIDALV